MSRRNEPHDDEGDWCEPAHTLLLDDGVHDHSMTADGVEGNMAQVWLDA